MKRRGFAHGKAGQRRRRSADYDNYPLLGLGLPILSGCLMDQERRRGGECERVRREKKERRR